MLRVTLWISVLVLSGVLLTSAIAADGAEAVETEPVAAADGTGGDNTSDADKTVTQRGPLEKVTETFKRGGPIMFVLLATSIIGLTFALERVFGLRKRHHIPSDLVKTVEDRIRIEGIDSARLELKGKDAALAIVLDGVLARKNATREERERILEDEAGRVLWDLRHNIRPVGIVASVAPLIGLLGTVFGLIGAFQKAAELGMDDPRNFAAGIYEALYTTAFGLTVAIPFLILYHYLRGTADVIMREIEDIVIRFIIDQDVRKNDPATNRTASDS